MRAIFGVLGLLIALAIIAMLAKKQMAALTITPPSGVASAPEGATVKQQSQYLQQQIKQNIESSLQQPRPMPDDK